MKGKILVIDAEPVVRSVMANILSRAGYELLEAGDLEAAMEQGGEVKS